MVGFPFFAQKCIYGLLAASFTHAAPYHRPDAGSSLALPDKRDDANSASSDDKLVFCHFMIGIVGDRTSAADYDSDMQLAKDLGIDAFALNIGTDDFSATQLSYAYESAANNDMKVFISFDFNWFDPATDAAKVGQMIANFSQHPSQLRVDRKAFASSFAGDGLDVSAMKSSAGIDIFFAPNFHPSQTSDHNAFDAALNWMGWDSNGNNKAPVRGGTNVTVVDGDLSYKQWLSTKPYIAPVSPWFSTHYGAEVSYSKNFVFPSDLLWFNRWNEVLLQSPSFVEIITWNDYGESHYIGPLSSPHYDDGASKWVNDMPHDGFRDLAKPYIAAYKAGAKSVDPYIEEDQIVYWYRPTPSDVECDSTDNTMGAGTNTSGNYFHGKPNGSGDMQDTVFVVTLLTDDASLSVTSGTTTKTFQAKAGANAFEVPMGVGQQTFSLTRDSEIVLSGTSLKDIQSSCICGIYNFNAYVGTLPEQDSDPLGTDGLASFTVGLSATTCSATPSLGIPTGPVASATITGSSSIIITTETSSIITTPIATSQPSPATSVASTTATPSSSSQATAPSPPETTSSVQSTASSTSSQAQPSASSTAGATPTCNGGTNADGQSGNLSGLCSFACAHGYCPPGPCVCTSTGTPETYQAGVGTIGCPLPSEDLRYKGLCAFSCNLGYCPETACTTSCSSS